VSYPVLFSSSTIVASVSAVPSPLRYSQLHYSIPRCVSTDDLAEEFDLSDQAITERLRRAIIAPVTNTLSLNDED